MTGTRDQTDSHLHREYQAVFGCLDAAGVRYCLLRPLVSLESERLGTDLDLLVDRDESHLAMKVLTDIGYHVLRSPGYIPEKAVLVKWTPEGLAFLDLHLSLIVKGYEYLDTNGALTRCVRQNSIPVLCRDDMIVVLLVHDLLGRRDLRRKTIVSIEELIDGVEPSGEVTVSDLRDFGIDGLIPVSMSEVIELATDEAERVRRIRALKRRIIRKRPKTLLRLLRIRFRRNTGAIISFLGPDGSGKTTIVEGFSAQITSLLGRKTSSYYMGPWGHYKMERMMDLVNSKVPHSVGELVQEYHEALATTNAREKATISGGWLTVRAMYLEMARRKRLLTSREDEQRLFLRKASKAWLAFRYFRGHLRYWIFLVALGIEFAHRYVLVSRDRRNGCVVVCDRYVYDFVSGAMHGITKRYRWIRYALCSLYPRPDIAFLLCADERNVVARKQDLSLGALRSMQQFYDDMALRWNFVRLDADGSAEEVAERLFKDEFGRIIDKLRT